jgi:hypothetical protein
MTFFWREFGGSMSNLSISEIADHIKFKARKLKKNLGITYTEALNQLSVKQGYSNWEHLQNVIKKIGSTAVMPVVTTLPEPLVEKYYGYFSNVPAEHPNAKLPLKKHQELGQILKDLTAITSFHKRAYRAVNDIRLKMDSWLGFEYTENEVPIEIFNKVYIGYGTAKPESYPDENRIAELRKLLQRVRSPIETTYPDCKPLRLMLRRFDAAEKFLSAWPIGIKIPQYKDRIKRLDPGTFVTLKGSKKLVVVLHHDTRSKVVHGYNDGGNFWAGRHEVTLLKEQPQLSQFKPQRLLLPYGKWICVDGTEVLYNRDYAPIWQKSPKGNVTKIDADTWVEHIDHSKHYYDDRTAPYYGNKQTFELCLRVLDEWGVKDKLPQVFDLWPEAVKTGDARILSEKNYNKHLISKTALP